MPPGSEYDSGLLGGKRDDRRLRLSRILEIKEKLASRRKTVPPKVCQNAFWVLNDNLKLCERSFRSRQDRSQTLQALSNGLGPDAPSNQFTNRLQRNEILKIVQAMV